MLKDVLQEGQLDHRLMLRQSSDSCEHPCPIIRYAKLKFMTILQATSTFGT